jgi:hypothetical protein
VFGRSRVSHFDIPQDASPKLATQDSIVPHPHSIIRTA